ncbi:MAG TPA: hypothetical protein VN694_00465 [Caulobacteraceae bacterium]|nr:hypothetical protein [Caulobacteraceae bacterium]
MIFRRALAPMLALWALALLGACNMVVTKEPVFGAADAAGAPVLRSGVWDGDPKPDCQVDESKPLSQWPSCANGFVVMDDHRVGNFNDQGGKHAWTTTNYVLAAGQPRILQLYFQAGADPMMPTAYFYAAYRPTRFDDQGRIVAGRSWIVICGPPPAQPAAGNAGGKQRTGTEHPFRGLTMDSDGNNCSPDTPAALRNAARESRPLTAPKDISGSHWVRDGEK